MRFIMSWRNDYKSMVNNIKAASKVNWPNSEPQENFSFSVSDESGVFDFKFKWLNDRWNCWVTLPDGTTRQAGVYPNVISWSGFLDFGLVFVTDLKKINFEQLYLTEAYILKWQ